MRTAAQSETAAAGEGVDDVLKNGRLQELIVSLDQQGGGNRNRDQGPVEGDQRTSEPVDVAIDNFGYSERSRLCFWGPIRPHLGSQFFVSLRMRETTRYERCQTRGPSRGIRSYR